MGEPKAASQPRHIKADPSRLMNNLSPGVVSNPSIPRLGACGAFMAHMIITRRAHAIEIKNIAVGSVQAIHDKSICRSPF